MIEVIKHGMTKFKTMCKDCGCEFTYTTNDFISGGVHCPDCGKWCTHSLTNTIIGSEKEDSDDN